ncbi:hypothetical protein B4U84_20235 [Westiellopsis prolifica IICB1]|nr:hypothetical protein B4U84_20235 [Westiellopsis prolifica IICB1]
MKDVFLSHASFDKEEYVRPLAKELERRKISYWLDEAEIQWGDKIVEKINEGLNEAKFVVIFLSENFINRNWSESELYSALNRENSEGKVIVLPLLIGEVSVVLKKYPLLRDKAYLSWDVGVSRLAEEVQRRLNLDGVDQVTSSTHSTRSNYRKSEITIYRSILGGGDELWDLEGEGIPRIFLSKGEEKRFELPPGKYSFKVRFTKENHEVIYTGYMASPGSVRYGSSDKWDGYLKPGKYRFECGVMPVASLRGIARVAIAIAGMGRFGYTFLYLTQTSYEK